MDENNGFTEVFVYKVRDSKGTNGKQNNSLNVFFFFLGGGGGWESQEITSETVIPSLPPIKNKWCFQLDFL